MWDRYTNASVIPIDITSCDKPNYDIVYNFAWQRFMPVIRQKTDLTVFTCFDFGYSHVLNQYLWYIHTDIFVLASYLHMAVFRKK